MNQGGQPVIWRFDFVAELAQGSEERGLGTFVHSRNAVQAIHALAKADKRAQESRRCARIADKEIERIFACAAARNFPPRP